jgi:acyl-homoserine lactone acylase PvdQ
MSCWQAQERTCSSRMPRLVRVAIPCVAAPPASRGNRPQPGGSFTIERDAWGVPHISSETNDGLFRGQGYAVAEDRLWQLELYSRTAAGTLSEILGGFYLDADQWTRREGYTDAEIDAQLAALRPETRAIFASYAMGVNQRIVEVMADPEALLPYEFWETGATPSYWTDRKVLAVTRYLALTFGITGGRELYMANQLESLGPELYDDSPDAAGECRPGTARKEPGGGEERRGKSGRTAAFHGRSGAEDLPGGLGDAAIGGRDVDAGAGRARTSPQVRKLRCGDRRRTFLVRRRASPGGAPDRHPA